MALDLAMEAGVDLDVHADLGLASSIELDELRGRVSGKKNNRAWLSGPSYCRPCFNAGVC